MPYEINAWIEEVSVLSKAGQYLQHSTIGAESLSYDPLPSDKDHCFLPWYGTRHGYVPDYAKG